MELFVCGGGRGCSNRISPGKESEYRNSTGTMITLKGPVGLLIAMLDEY